MERCSTWTSENQVMAVDVDTAGDTPRIGVPEALFVAPGTFSHQAIIVDSSGSRFLLPVSEGRQAESINVVLNWTQELLERVPVP